GAHGAAGMERGENEVARLRGREGERDRLEIAQLADADDVGIFAQGAPKGPGEGGGVTPDLALVDDAAFRVVDVFDRIFDREDVVAPLLVEDVDQCREGGGFSAAGRAGEQN